MTSKVGTERIGVIEVGSKAVRFLVADFAWDGSFRQVDAGAYRHQIDLEKLESDGLVAIHSQLSAMFTEVEKFHARVMEKRCDKTAFYGTELCRRLKKQMEFPFLFDFFTLTEAIEALGAWAAGFLATQKTAGRYTIIDQGTGSTEVVTAFGNSTNVEIDKRSDLSKLRIGNEEIEKRFSTDDVNGFIVWVRRRLDAAEGELKQHEATQGQPHSLVMLGSAPTKLAFNIKHKRDIEDDYDPKRTHETMLSLDDLKSYYNDKTILYKTDPEGARRSIDRRVDEFPLVIGGALFLLLLCQRLRFREFRVSRYGTRFGIAFLIRRGVIA